MLIQFVDGAGGDLSNGPFQADRIPSATETVDVGDKSYVVANKPPRTVLPKAEKGGPSKAVTVVTLEAPVAGAAAVRPAHGKRPLNG